MGRRRKSYYQTLVARARRSELRNSPGYSGITVRPQSELAPKDHGSLLLRRSRSDPTALTSRLLPRQNQNETDESNVSSDSDDDRSDDGGDGPGDKNDNSQRKQREMKEDEPDIDSKSNSDVNDEKVEEIVEVGESDNEMSGDEGDLANRDDNGNNIDGHCNDLVDEVQEGRPSMEMSERVGKKSEILSVTSMKVGVMESRRNRSKNGSEFIPANSRQIEQCVESVCRENPVPNHVLQYWNRRRKQLGSKI